MSGTLRNDWRRTLAVVSGGHFFSHFYMLALPPLFPMLRAEFGLSNVELGLVVSVVALGGLLQMPVGGVVDRIGAKWVFVAGVGVTASGVALVGLGGSYPAVLALAVVTGVGQSAFHPSDYALIDAVADPDRRGRAFSVHTFSGYVGYASAPIVVGTLALATDWRVALFAVGAVGVLYAVVSADVLDPVHPSRAERDDAASVAEREPERSSRWSVAPPAILAMASFYLLFGFASKGLQTFTTVLAVDTFGLAESVGNTLLTAFFALGAVGVLVGGVLADRFPPERVIAVALVVGVSALAVAVAGGASIGAFGHVGLFGLVGFFTTLALPSRDRIVSRQSARGSTGRSFGVVFTGGTAGALSGPAILGAVGDAASLSRSFWVIGAVWLAAGALAFSLGRGWLPSAASRQPAD